MLWMLLKISWNVKSYILHYTLRYDLITYHEESKLKWFKYKIFKTNNLTMKKTYIQPTSNRKIIDVNINFDIYYNWICPNK